MRAQEDADLGPIAEELQGLHRTNEALRNQNERLLSLNERLMGEAESLRQEITKLRQAISGPGNVFDTYGQSIQDLQERVGKLGKGRSIEEAEMEISRHKRRAEDAETNLRRVVDQNRSLTSELDALSRKGPDLEAERRARENLRLLEESRSQFESLNRDHQKLFDEHQSLRRKTAGQAGEEYMRSKLNQLEQENSGLNDIINDLKVKNQTLLRASDIKDKEIDILKEELRQIQSDLTASRGSRNESMADEIRRLQITVREKETRIESLQTDLDVVRMRGTSVSGQGVRILRDEINRYFVLPGEGAEKNRKENNIMRMIDTLEASSKDSPVNTPKKSSMLESRVQSTAPTADLSEMLRKAIEAETNSKEAVRVKKNDDDQCYEVSFTKSDTETTPNRVMRIPAGFIDTLKNTEVIRYNGPDAYLRERLEGGGRVVEQIKTADQDNLSHLTRQSRIGESPIHLSATSVNSLQPGRRQPNTGVVFDRQFEGDIGPDFALLSSIISRGLRPLPEGPSPTQSKWLVTLDNYGPKQTKLNSNSFFFRNDPAQLKALGQRDHLINELLGQISSESNANPNTFVVFRQTETPTSITIDKFLLDVRNWRPNSSESYPIHETFTIDIAEVTRAALYSDSAKKFRLEGKKMLTSGPHLRTYSFMLDHLTQVPRGELTKIEEEPFRGNFGPRESSLDPYLDQFIRLLVHEKTEPESVFLKQRQENSVVVIDALSSKRRNERTAFLNGYPALKITRRAVFEPDCDINGKPPMVVEKMEANQHRLEKVVFQPNGSPLLLPLTLEDNLNCIPVRKDVERLTNFEEKISKLPSEIPAGIARSLRRRIANPELSELLYELQNEATLFREGHIFVRELFQGNDKILERLSIADSERNPGNFKAQVMQRLILKDYLHSGASDWVIRKETPTSRPDYKKVEHIKMEKGRWPDPQMINDFKPRPARSRDAQEVDQKLISTRLSNGEKAYVLDEFELSAGDSAIVTDLSSKRAQGEGYYVTLITFDPDNKHSTFDKYLVPQLGRNFAVLNRRVRAEPRKETMFDELHEDKASVIAHYSIDPTTQNKQLRSMVTLRDAGEEESRGVGVEGPLPPGESMSAINHFKNSSKSEQEKDKDRGQVLVRESIDPVTQDVVICKLVVPDVEKIEPDHPEGVNQYGVSVKSRVFEKSASRLDSSHFPKVDIAKASGGLGALTGLITSPDKPNTFLFLQETEGKLILEQVEFEKDKPVLIERIRARPINAVLTPAQQDLSASDLRIVKETFNAEGQRKISTVRIGDSTNSVGVSTVQDLSVFGDELRKHPGSFIQEDLEKISLDALPAFFKFLFASRRGERSVYRHLLQGWERVLIPSEVVAEKFTISREPQGLLVKRQIQDEDMKINEEVEVVKQFSGIRSSQAHTSEQEITGIPIVVEKTEVKTGLRAAESVVVGTGRSLGSTRKIETEFLRKERASPEFEDGINAIFEVHASEQSQSVRPGTKYIIWQKKEHKRTIFKRIKIEHTPQGRIQAELVDRVEIRKDESLPTRLSRNMSSIQEREERGCQYSHFTRETFDHSLNQRTLRKLRVEEDPLSGMAKIKVISEDSIKGIDLTDRTETQLLANFAFQAFIGSDFLLERNSVITQATPRNGRETIERNSVFLEGDLPEDNEVQIITRESIEVDSWLLSQEGLEEARAVRSMVHDSKNIIQTLDCTRRGQEFNFRVIEKVESDKESYKNKASVENLPVEPGVRRLVMYAINETTAKTSRVILLEDQSLTPAAHILSLTPDHETNAGVVNPVKHHPLRYTVAVEEKLRLEQPASTEHLYSAVNQMMGRVPRDVSSINREVINSSKQVTSESLEVEEFSGQVKSRQLNMKDGAARFEEWLSPVDYSVLCKLFGVALGQTETGLILRKIRDKDHVIYEKIKFNPQHRGSEMSVLERVSTSGDYEAISAVMPHVLFHLSSLDDIKKSRDITRMSRDDERGQQTPQAIKFDRGHPGSMEQGLRDALFRSTNSSLDRRSIPLLLSYPSDSKDQRMNAQRRIVSAPSSVLLAIRLLLELDQHRGLDFLLAVELDQSSRVVGKKIQVRNFEPGDMLATVVGDRTNNRGPFERELLRADDRSKVKERIMIIDGKTDIQNTQRDSYSPADPREQSKSYENVEFFIKYLTKYFNQLRGGNHYIRKMDEPAKVTYEVYELLTGNQESLVESVEIYKKRDLEGKHQAVRKSYFQNTVVEDQMDINPTVFLQTGGRVPMPVESRGTRVIEENPKDIYKGNPITHPHPEKVHRKTPFDFEDAFSCFLKESQERNFLVCQRVENGEKLIEKIQVNRDLQPNVIDRYRLDYSDLVKRSGGERFNPDSEVDLQEVMRMVASSNSHEQIYLVRSILRGGKPSRQVIRLLRNRSDPNTNELARLGEESMRPDEYRAEVEPYLKSLGKLQQYLNSQGDIDYVPVKEFLTSLGFSSNMRSEVLGYATTVEPVFREQLLNVGVQLPDEPVEARGRLEITDRV